MINKPETQGRWHELKGKLKAKWGQLSDDDLKNFSGNTEQLVGVIQRKTGEMRESIENSLQEITSGGDAAMQQAKQAVQQYSQQAGEAMQEGYDQLAEAFQEGYAQAESMVRSRPAESIAVVFGVGLITGALLSLTLRSR
jgi:uncharacterized protein YjbJ (UPF0337 family)